ncbi:hypothetical protein FS749_013291 [Ceratobasidium sp. UAMH 11750]|nr:hypothetical protein FS749_013291 [Ceratobasidium sp. UAMH 11750]
MPPSSSISTASSTSSPTFPRAIFAFPTQVTVPITSTPNPTSTVRPSVTVVVPIPRSTTSIISSSTPSFTRTLFVPVPQPSVTSVLATPMPTAVTVFVTSSIGSIRTIIPIVTTSTAYATTVTTLMAPVPRSASSPDVRFALIKLENNTVAIASFIPTTPVPTMIANQTVTVTPVPEPSASNINKGAIAGGVVGGVVGLALVLGALYAMARWYRARRNGWSMRIGSSTELETRMSETRPH